MRTIIVGGGVAAASAAATLRELGDDGDIVVISDETEPPYDRPPLSKGFLQGRNPEIAAKPEEFWRDNRVELRLGVRATAIDTVARTVEAGGERLLYDRLLIATGGRPRALPVPGADLPGVHLLRTVADARAIRRDAEHASRAVVVGMGFIGAEVAASLRMREIEVVALTPTLPLERVLGRQMAEAIAALHERHGVDLRLGVSVAGIEGAGRVERVHTDAGDAIECDVVVAGVGIEVNTELAERAGIGCDNGIRVDAFCRTDAPHVYAAGDVASWDHPRFGRIRLEHWQNAIEMGAAAARSMLGKDDPYDRVPWFWSDQYEAVIQYAGHHREAADVIFRGDPQSQSFLAFYRDGSAVVQAVAGLDRGREVRRAMPLIAAGRPVDAALLRDESVDLKSLAP